MPNCIFRIQDHTEYNLDTTAITPASIMTLVRIRLIRDLIGCSKRGLFVKLRHNSHKLTFSKSFASRAARPREKLFSNKCLKNNCSKRNCGRKFAVKEC